MGGEANGEAGAKGEAAPMLRAADAPARLLLLSAELWLLMGVTPALPAALVGARAGVLLCKPLLSSDSACKISLKLGRAEGLREMQRRMMSASGGGASLGTSNGSSPAGSSGCKWGGVGGGWQSKTHGALCALAVRSKAANRPVGSSSGNAIGCEIKVIRRPYPPAGLTCGHLAHDADGLHAQPGALAVPHLQEQHACSDCSSSMGGVRRNRLLGQTED